jgi:hypothetical protein
VTCRGGGGAGPMLGTGATATTGATDIRTAPDSFAARAPLPARVIALDGPDDAVAIHRVTKSTGISAPSRSRIEVRARLSNWRTAPLLAPSRLAISS